MFLGIYIFTTTQEGEPLERTTTIQHPVTVIEGAIETVVMSNLGFVTQCLRINNIEQGIVTLILFY